MLRVGRRVRMSVDLMEEVPPVFTRAMFFFLYVWCWFKYGLMGRLGSVVLYQAVISVDPSYKVLNM